MSGRVAAGAMHTSHDHTHGPKSYSHAIAIGIALNLSYVVVELVYGLIANSLSLVADAGHNFSDVLGLLLAWGATWLVRPQPTARHSYGFRRSSVLAALFNAVIWVAAVGIAVNGVTAWLFLSGQEGDLNVAARFCIWPPTRESRSESCSQDS
jgi:cobalt-zinc-cadmium efflux system protein